MNIGWWRFLRNVSSKWKCNRKFRSWTKCTRYFGRQLLRPEMERWPSRATWTAKSMPNKILVNLISRGPRFIMKLVNDNRSRRDKLDDALVLRPLKDASCHGLLSSIRSDGYYLSMDLLGIYCLLIDTITKIRILCAFYSRNHSRDCFLHRFLSFPVFEHAPTFHESSRFAPNRSLSLDSGRTVATASGSFQYKRVLRGKILECKKDTRL